MHSDMEGSLDEYLWKYLNYSLKEMWISLLFSSLYLFLHFTMSTYPHKTLTTQGWVAIEQELEGGKGGGWTDEGEDILT